MIISTKDFGNVDIAEEDVIYFPHGLFGYPENHRYVILFDKRNADTNPFMWLQSVDEDGPRFVVIDPLKFFSDYDILNDEIKEAISLKDKEDLRLLSIATVTLNAEQVYANLMCPVAINARDNIAIQAVLADGEKYPIRYNLLKKEDC